MSEVRAMLSNERGLTLAEILVAVAIIGVGLVGLAVVVPVSSYGVQEGNQVTTATFLAEQMIERARAAAWTGVPAIDCLGVGTASAPVPTGGQCTGAPSPTATQFPDEANVSGYTQYARIVRVQDCSTGGGCAGVVSNTLRRVTVTVTYRPLTASGVSPSNKTVTLEWLVTQK
ncbi:MAG TPA: prepilin-type N-terminal cleavage/methylation domain-containing protein [Methylomirabilota bacterium]|nr:prepilin-type N-terminal cleavage/methylation domain-containing protein [Methylomirabilota bacterium]